MPLAIIFGIATIRDEVRALRDDRAEQSDPARLLEGTPLAMEAGHQPTRTPLSLVEQVNVVAVRWVAGDSGGVLHRRALRVLLSARIVAILDDVAVLWSAEETCPVVNRRVLETWFGIHVPVPQTVVHVSLFVAVLSGLYFTVSTSVDPIYRERFFDPLISDLAISLAGRDVYLELERQRP